MSKKEDAVPSMTSVDSELSDMSKRPGYDLWQAQYQMRREPIRKHTDALHRLILETAVRKDELAKSRWDEFDLAEAVWTMPAGRIKNGRVRKIPLTSVAVKILRTLMENTSPTDSRVFAALGRFIYEAPAFQQSMSRLGFTYRSVAELRQEASRRMDKRLMKMSKEDIAAFFGSSRPRSLMKLCPPRPMAPADSPRDHARH